MQGLLFHVFGPTFHAKVIVKLYRYWNIAISLKWFNEINSERFAFCKIIYNCGIGVNGENHLIGINLDYAYVTVATSSQAKLFEFIARADSWWAEVLFQSKLYHIHS